MINVTRAGHLLYGLRIIAYGIQQLIIGDFRPQILPGFPSWAHTNFVFPFLTGVLMIVAGLIVSGIVKVAGGVSKKAALALASYFFALILFSHIPYLLFIYPHKLSHLGSWGDLLKALAFCGASLIMAGSFLRDPSDQKENNLRDSSNRVLFFFGRLFYCTTIILFGCNHYVY